MINRIKIMKKLLKEFVKEDKADPFVNRVYAEETKRIYKLLIVPEDMSDFGNETDKAIYDIVGDLLRHFEKVRYHLKV